MKFSDNGIEIFGVSDCIPMLSNYFKEFDFQVNQKLCDNDFEIEKILSVNVNIQIGILNIIKTPIMISNEGIFFSGYKLKVELIIDMKFKYMIQKSLGLSKNKFIKTIYIVIPLEHNKINAIDLLRKGRIIINSYIEDIYCELRYKNVAYVNLSAMIIANLNSN